MADVYVNALTTISTEPGTTDSLVCVNRNTNEGQIIDYNLLADKILAKLTSKQYSALATTSKLITGAINELDSDVASLNSSISTFSMKRFTITANANTEISFDANSRIVFVVLGANTNMKGMYLATANSASVLDIVTVLAAQSINYTLDTGKITISSTLSGHVFAFVLSGAVS